MKPISEMTLEELDAELAAHPSGAGLAQDAVGGSGLATLAPTIKTSRRTNGGHFQMGNHF
ncbi:hypothetical protein EB235_24625 [Mesorhizobium loti R88b]|uniref:Uncharacterized protein n=1 Tax=Mesorhizobium loti R88b TaxID=935548 RepID=A0A6M7WPF2_RHILI|nr:hypothetical protein EB235_24625 [Mesorhizobium loti R88b]